MLFLRFFRLGCYTQYLWEGALNSLWERKYVCWLCYLALAGEAGEPPVLQRQAGSSHQKCSNECLKTKVSLDKNQFPHLFGFWSTPVNEQENLALQNSVRRSTEVSHSPSFCVVN